VIEAFHLMEIADKAVNLAVDLGANYADVRIEKEFSTEIRLTNERFDSAVNGIDKGIGVRVLFNGAWGFSSTCSLTGKDVKDAVENAVKAAKATSIRIKERAVLAPVPIIEDKVETPVRESLAAVGIDKKMNLALKVSGVVRDYSHKIVSANIRYEDRAGEKFVSSSEGAKVLMRPSLVRLVIMAVAREGEKITSATEPFGLHGGFEVLDWEAIKESAITAAKRAVEMLKAHPPPSGRFTVVVNPTLTGTFAHEAVGHASEADLVAAGESILQGKIGQKIGSECVTICDGSTYEKGWGFSLYDDEGVPTQKKTIIDHGVLNAYILNREAAAKLNLKPNGGARAQSYAFRPIVRMSDTYIMPGDQTFEELLEGIRRGVYVKGTRGGAVDPAKGTFQFNAEEAYLIKNGEVTTPLLDVSLSGLTLETLSNIDAVAKDLKLEPGRCGKEGQLVYAGTGGPHIRIRNAAVGGRA